MANKHIKTTNRERDVSKLAISKKSLETVIIEASSRPSRGRPSKYNAEQKRICLELWAQNISCEKISQVTGIPRTTIATWSTGYDVDKLDYSEVCDVVKDTLVSQFLIGAKKAATAAVSDEKIAKASALQCGTLAAMFVDKSRLLSGESTSNILNVFHKLDNERGEIQGLDLKRMELEAELHTID